MLYVLMRLVKLESMLPDEAIKGTTAEWQQWSNNIRKLMVTSSFCVPVPLIVTDDTRLKSEMVVVFIHYHLTLILCQSRFC